MDHSTDTLPEEALSEHSETRQHETSSPLEPANNGTGHFNPALLRVIHRKGYCMLVAHWEDADALLRHDFPALNISDLELFTRDVVGPLQTLAILQRPGGLGEQFGEAIRQRLDAIGWEGTATFRALPEDCPDVTTLAERHAEEPHKFTGYILNLLADPQAQKIRSDDTASAAAGEASGDATLQEAKQDPITRQYEGANTWLYASYRDYADASGDRKIVPLQSFRRLMEDLCEQQLKLPNVVWGRDDQGRYFDGLRLRRELDAKSPTFIEQAVALMGQGASPPESTQSPGNAETAGTMTPGIPGNADSAGDAEISKKAHRDPTHPIEVNGNGGRVGPPINEGDAPTSAAPAEFSIDAGLPPLGPPASPAGSALARRSPCYSCRGRRFWLKPGGDFSCAACHPPASDALAIGWLELTDGAPGAVSRNDHKGRSIAGAPGP